MQQYRKKTFYAVVSGVMKGCDPGNLRFHDRGHIKENGAYVMIEI